MKSTDLTLQIDTFSAELSYIPLVIPNHECGNWERPNQSLRNSENDNRTDG